MGTDAIPAPTHVVLLVEDEVLVRMVAAVVSSRDPGIAIVVTSGRERSLPGELPDGAVFENKPFTSASLVNALRRAIERNQATRTGLPPEVADAPFTSQTAEGGTDRPIILPGKIAS